MQSEKRQGIWSLIYGRRAVPHSRGSLYSLLKISTHVRISPTICIMSTLNDFDIQELSQSERILLAEKLWDSIADNQDSLEVTASQKRVLEERLEAYKKSPNEGSSWEEVKNEMK